MVSAVNSTSSTPTSTTTGSTSDASITGTGGDFETFLRMLTTQIQNQDPLNPMDSSEFAVQLATFSGVEQQVRTNSLLSDLVSGSTGGQLGQLSSWIGKEVRTTAPVYYDGEPVTLQIAPDATADAANLVVLDAQGREVSRESIGTGEGEVDWQGKTATGETLAAGNYQFRLESLKDGAVIATDDVPAYSMVTGAELNKGTPQLLLSGGSAVDVDEVTAVRS